MENNNDDISPVAAAEIPKISPEKGGFKRYTLIAAIITAIVLIFSLICYIGYGKFSQTLTKLQNEIITLSHENAELKAVVTNPDIPASSPIAEVETGITADTQTIPSPPVENDRATGIIVVVNLREAIRSGKPFMPEMLAAEALFKTDNTAASYIALLTPVAEKGRVDKEQLYKKFYEIKKQILSISEQLPENPSFQDRLAHSFSKVVRIRKIDHSSEALKDTKTIVQEADAALARGDINEAVRLLNMLPEENSKRIVSTWLEEAELYLKVENAIQNLYSYVASPVYKGGATPPKGMQQ